MKETETAPAAPQNENNGIGSIKINNNVISSIARRAALQVEGVSRLAGNQLVDNIAEIIGSQKMQDRAINIENGEDGKVGITIEINIKVGFRLPDVAEKVQRAVIEQVESVTGMTVARVDVLVQEIEEEKPEEPEIPAAGDVASLDK